MAEAPATAKQGYRRGQHPNSLNALKVRPVGAAANPHGRPPAGESFNEAIRYWIEMPPQVLLGFLFGENELPPERNNVRHVLAYVQVMASLFDQSARSFTMNKLDGMPKQSIDAQVNTTEKWEQVQQTGLRRVV